MYPSYHLSTELGDFNAQAWFRSDEIPNPTCLLAGDNAEQMINVLMASHASVGDIPVIIGDLSGVYAEITRDAGGTVITVTDDPDEQIAAAALCTPMICLDLDATPDVDKDTIRTLLWRSLDHMEALFTAQDNNASESGGREAGSPGHLTVFIDNVVASPDVDEDLYRHLDEVPRNAPWTSSWYMLVDLDRIFPDYDTRPESRYITGIIQTVGRIICGTLRSDAAPRAQQVLELTDAQVAVLTGKPGTPDTSARVSTMAYQYLMTTGRDHSDMVTDRVGLDDDGALVREIFGLQLTDYSMGRYQRPGPVGEALLRREHSLRRKALLSFTNFPGIHLHDHAEPEVIGAGGNHCGGEL